jgi:hypothetical protein
VLNGVFEKQNFKLQINVEMTYVMCNPCRRTFIYLGALNFFNCDIHPFETSHIIMVHLNCSRWPLNLVGEKWSLQLVKERKKFKIKIE